MARSVLPWNRVVTLLRADCTPWLIAKGARFGPTLQLNLAVLLLIHVLAVDTGWFAFLGPTRFAVAPGSLIVQYALIVAAAIVAIGMLARRRWAWSIEGGAMCTMAVAWTGLWVWIGFGSPILLTLMMLTPAPMLLLAGVEIVRYGQRSHPT